MSPPDWSSIPSPPILKSTVSVERSDARGAQQSLPKDCGTTLRGDDRILAFSKLVLNHLPDCQRPS